MVSIPRQARPHGSAGLTLAGELLKSLPAGVAYVAGPDLVYEFASEQYRQMVGDRELIGRPLAEALPELAAERLAAIRRVLLTGQPVQGRESEVWIRRNGQAPEQLFVDFAYQPVPDAAGGVAGVLLYGSDVTGHVRDRRLLEDLAVRLAATLTARERAEQQRATSLECEEETRSHAGVARERLAFLLRAGDLVAASRNPDELLEQVTALVVPTLADYCVAFMPTPDQMLRATMATHRDPVRAEVLKLLRQHPIPAAGPLISQKAYTTGTTQLARTFDSSTPRWTDAVPELMAVVHKVDPASALAVPLKAGRQPFGVLLLGRGGSRPLFTETDVAVVEELARRLSAGLANAEAFVREHTVAETLQRALLPAALPEVEGADLAVHYLPASDGVHVGGDWYDAFPLDNGRIGLAIGDVAGHSIESASVMGQVSGLLRGYAIDTPSPEEVLRRTDAAICRLLPEAVATAFYAVLDPATGELAYSNAGHPPPLYASARGNAEFLDAAAGAMLGTGAGTAFTSGSCRLPPGAMLLLYTDGLIEHRHRDISAGLTALSTAFRRFTDQTAGQLCQFVQAALLGPAPRADDVCILAVRLPERPGSRLPSL